MVNQVASEKLNRFIGLLEEIFELDKADLDFGIYRILNIRRNEIMRFFSEGLPKKVQEALAPFAADTSAIEKRIAEIEKQCDEVGVEVSKSKMAEEYARLKAQLASGTDLSSLEADVYSALYTFFNRYYEEGDFISKRRYKEGVYAIPYEGEEVKLYWANADQYYIKTTENFRDYTFIHNGKKVHFRLVDAKTEKNNNKELEKRQFMLYTESPERPELKTIEEVDGELVIRFVYDVPNDNKKVKWLEANLAAITEAITTRFKDWYHLLSTVPGAKKESRTVLEKHLSAYVAKNTFDYFIHKDLRGFLTRELDFFIKSEVIHLDDIDTTDEKRADSYLAKVRAIKRVGRIIIDFLAQIEDFQKKLWLKKKFVVETNWCITLDKVDEKFYPEIIANAAQIAEWRKFYSIDEIQGDDSTIGYSEPLTIEFLRQNRNLVIDTRHFSADFKERLIASIDNLDEQTGGLLIHSENFQALRFLSERYHKKIKCIYIDPPYNSKTSEIAYKNNYKHSSWLSLIENRITLSRVLATEDGSHIIAIDENEQENLGKLLDIVFPDYEKICVSVMHNKKGIQGNYFSHNNEFAYFLIPRSLPSTHGIIVPESEWEYTNLRKWGRESERHTAKNCFYPIFVEDDKIVGFGDVCDDSFHPGASNVKDGNRTIVYPVDSSGVERKWRYARNSVESISHLLKVHITNEGEIQIHKAVDERPLKTIWDDPRYIAGDYGTNWLTDLNLKINDDLYPKSVHLVEDSIFAVSDSCDVVLDYFAGSGTTGHAVLNLNRKAPERGNRKYILVEMGEYFHSVTLPRMKKVIYSNDWKNGKPQKRDAGISHILKYIFLESYEDTLSNIELDDNRHQLSLKFGDEYLVHYMFDYEAKGSLLSLDSFNTPFSYKLKIIENNETKLKTVDLCETFNYLIGLSVTCQSAVSFYRALLDDKGEYEGAVKLERDDSGEYGFKQIEGTLPDGRHALVIWRTITGNLLQSNAALDAYFTKHRINPANRDFDIIYVNGDNNLENLRNDDESWKVQRIEPVFKQKMFEEA